METKNKLIISLLLVTQVSGVMAKSLITTQQEKANTLNKETAHQAGNYHSKYGEILKSNYDHYVAENKSYNDQFGDQIDIYNEAITKAKKALIEAITSYDSSKSDKSLKSLTLNLVMAQESKEGYLGGIQDMPMREIYSFKEWLERRAVKQREYEEQITQNHQNHRKEPGRKTEGPRRPFPKTVL